MVGWSATYMLKINGDSIPPCGTPALIFTIPDVDVLYWTWKFLSVKYDLINKNKEEGRHFLSLNCNPSDPVKGL